MQFVGNLRGRALKECNLRSDEEGRPSIQLLRACVVGLMPAARQLLLKTSDTTRGF